MEPFYYESYHEFDVLGKTLLRNAASRIFHHVTAEVLKLFHLTSLLIKIEKPKNVLFILGYICQNLLIYLIY